MTDLNKELSKIKSKDEFIEFLLQQYEDNEVTIYHELSGNYEESAKQLEEEMNLLRDFAKQLKCSWI